MAIQKYLMSLNLDNGHTKISDVPEPRQWSYKKDELLLSNMGNKTTTKWKLHTKNEWR